MTPMARRIMTALAATLALLAASIGITLAVVARANDMSPRALVDYGIYRVSRIGKAPRPAPNPAGTRDDRWRQDLAYLASELPRLHANAFHATPRAVFEDAVAHLDATIPILSDAQLTVELMRIVALVGDGHTATWSWTERFRPYPLSFGILGDELWIVEADENHVDLLGARVLGIGSATVVDAVERVRPLLSYDSEDDFRVRAGHALAYAEVQQAVGLQPTANEAVLVIADRAGVEREVVVEALPAGDPVALRSAGATPLYRQRSEEDFWSTVLPGGVVYLRYNRCRDPDGFRQVAQDAFAAVDAYRDAALVVDLRGNDGGDERVIAPLLAGIETRRLGAAGRLWVLTDARTFSSATGNAWSLRQLGARLAGEPTGDGVDGWGEVERLTLPNSGIVVQYATRFWRRAGSEEPLEPDLPVEATVDDVLAGRDPVLDAVVAELARVGETPVRAIDVR